MRILWLPRGLVAAAILLYAPGARRAGAGEPPVWDGRQSLKRVMAELAEYFDAGKQRRAEIRGFLDSLGTLRPSDLKRFTKSLLKQARRHGQRLARGSGSVVTCEGASARVFFEGAKGKKRPLFIVPGGTGAADVKVAHRRAVDWFRYASNYAILLVPEVPRDRLAAWNYPEAEKFLLEAVEAAKRTFRIDTNRVYLAGVSKGGAGCWSIGCRHADRFAALGPSTGYVAPAKKRPSPETEGLRRGHIPNLLNTPVRFYHSRRDPKVKPQRDQAAHRYLTRLKLKGYAYEWEFIETDDEFHTFPRYAVKPLVDWLLARKRDPYPKHVVFEPSRPYKRRLFWLGVEKDVQIEGMIEGNTITLTVATPRPATTVHLNDGLVDLGKPVEIRVNGEKLFWSPVRPRLSVLLDTIAELRDPEQYYTAAVSIPAAPSPPPGFKVPAQWEYSAPLITPKKRAREPSRAQKDPTVVFYEGRWHVFMTAKLPTRSAIEHCSFEKWRDADKAKRTLLRVSESRYFCAPQVFFFTPHRKWYLIYQMGVPGRDKMWVACSTTTDISDPTSWTKAKPILDGGKDDPRAVGGLDYWIICDEKRAYLFLTSLNGKMWRLWTELERFPAGFDHCELALEAKIFEASHTYRLKGLDQYLTIVEENGRRYYKAYVADRLDGKWTPVADTAEHPFAGWRNIRPAEGVQAWTDNVSHGELLRDGHDQTLVVDPQSLRLLFQGMLDKDKAKKGYGAFRWRIGLMTPVRPE